ncbi:MAG: hypothetical protein C4525_12830 [Desulfarculus sp.]|jgi:hypothetical protein|nr:MAG: hypothetical protein C4525_12830 [Desulfarculus sp.]
MRLALFAAVLALALGLSACREGGSASPPPAGQPSQYLTIMDLPCDQVQRQVRARIQADASLGLASEKKVERGVGFVLPPRQEGPRRWSAVVLVECFGPLTTRLSVQVSAERQSGGVWGPEAAAADLEKAILDKATPQP